MLGPTTDYRHPPSLEDESKRPTKRARNTPPYSRFPDPAMFGAPEEPPISSEKPKGASGPVLAVQRVQEKDKNRRLSCRECRRLKLKCDRIFPCQSCVKRGCGSLCPEGALTSGRGSRFILANTEQLHEKITQLGDRVRELEEALEVAQSVISNQTHPLLSPDLLRIKTSQDLYTVPPCVPPPPDPSPSNKVRDIAAAPSLRPSDSTAHILDKSERFVTTESPPPEIPPDILQLSATFPFPWSVDLRIRKRIREALPPRQEALTICEEAQRNALWQYNMDASETFFQNLLHHCYTTEIEDLSPRRLALLLMILSIGCLVDLKRPLGSVYGEAYHHLARASVCEIPLMEEPDFDVLHALFFMIWYHLIFSDNKKAVGYAWNLMGFVVKLAQGLGLHRHNSRLKGIPEEDEKRRAVFWELLNLDCRMSLSLGRPPSICLAHVDTKPPSYNGAGLYVPKEEIVYHQWKNAFFIRVLTPVLEAIVAVDLPKYSHIIELDKMVRDFEIPAILDEQYKHGVRPRFLVMQTALLSMGRDIALLQLHRRFFTEAMSGPETFDLHHQYAPSVLATYLGAASVISAVEALFDQEQQLSVRFLHFWFNSFSAAVTLSLFISRAPSSPLAPYALQDLDRICQLFRRAAKILPFSGKSLPVMEKLADRARRIFLHSPSANSSSDPGHNGLTGYQYQSPSYPAIKPPPNHLPESFSNVHPYLVRYVEQIKYTAAPNPYHLHHPISAQRNLHPLQSGAPVSASSLTNLRATGDSWMPDIYEYASVGLSVENRYTRAQAQPTPFIPSSPRVDEKDTFNFDHGALMVDLKETSYMAWF